MSDRLISADKLMETIKAHHYPLVVKGLNSTDYGMFTLGIQQVVDEQPTVEAEPVRHGMWLERNSGLQKWIRCSVCNYRQHYTNKTNYCPNCGTKMDEVVEWLGE